MGINITEKIIARASGKTKVAPDDVVFVNVDKAMIHDVSGPGVIAVFEKLKKQGMKIERLWDPSKVWVAEDHFVPPADKMSAEERLTLTNMTTEAGAKSGIIEPDQKIRDYLVIRGKTSYNEVHGDTDAQYEK